MKFKIIFSFFFFSSGYITIHDILKAVSLGGFIKRVHMSGKHLTDMMEHSVKHYDPLGVTPPGAFLQVSGKTNKTVEIFL